MQSEQRAYISIKGTIKKKNQSDLRSMGRCINSDVNMKNVDPGEIKMRKLLDIKNCKKFYDDSDSIKVWEFSQAYFSPLRRELVQPAHFGRTFGASIETGVRWDGSFAVSRKGVLHKTVKSIHRFSVDCTHIHLWLSSCQMWCSLQEGLRGCQSLWEGLKGHNCIWRTFIGQLLTQRLNQWITVIGDSSGALQRKVGPVHTLRHFWFLLALMFPVCVQGGERKLKCVCVYPFLCVNLIMWYSWNKHTTSNRIMT